MDAFLPGKPAVTDKKAKTVKPALTKITFQDGSATSDRWRVWSGDKLLDLESIQGLQIISRSIAGQCPAADVDRAVR
jgi:hypothetical protein